MPELNYSIVDKQDLPGGGLREPAPGGAPGLTATFSWNP